MADDSNVHHDGRLHVRLPPRDEHTHDSYNPFNSPIPSPTRHGLSPNTPRHGMSRSNSAASFPHTLMRRTSSVGSITNSISRRQLWIPATTVRKPHKSTKIRGEVQKPWMKYPDPAKRKANAIFWAFVALAVGIAAALCVTGYLSVPSVGNLCLVMDDSYGSGVIDSAYWTHDVRLTGYRENTFDWTTPYSNNSFIQDGTLYLVPTLTSDYLGVDAITNGYTLNLTTDGTCTSTNVSQCAITSNATEGTILNPVMSARLTTLNKISIRYGKVEVVARMPLGDWIWPSISMFPVNNSYGEWPKSGEINIAGSRGNNNTYGDNGDDYVESGLHWGPVPDLDRYLFSWGHVQDKIKGYHGTFHRYTLEWNDKYITTYIDNKVYTTMAINFDQTFWKRGAFATFWQNGTVQQALTDPWYTSTNNGAPFDQSFYLSISAAIGGTSGYFPYGLGGKPWLDTSLNPKYDFWSAKDRWYPTWPTDPTQRGLAIKSVKVWQKC